ncbi:MAG: hypothetical protein ACD_46C00589G0004 [uncultured bacterium]|nr:MAG: hypothetical protein ACD_46C00589G0004 [uncultured bacterium]OGT50628.1 MAG: hypothetical protein A3E53_02835 [Gammaproteobacteria bacterium RIFCSPHIGHO2_12_FULL_39_24]
MATNQTVLTPKIYFIKDAESLTRRNRLTLRRWWMRDLFPCPSKINNRLFWKAEVIHQWINSN